MSQQRSDMGSRQREGWGGEGHARMALSGDNNASQQRSGREVREGSVGGGSNSSSNSSRSRRSSGSVGGSEGSRRRRKKGLREGKKRKKSRNEREDERGAAHDRAEINGAAEQGFHEVGLARGVSEACDDVIVIYDEEEDGSHRPSTPIVVSSDNDESDQ